VCLPAQTIDATFAGRPPQFRAISDAVIAFVSDLGPVHVDAVEVGVFLKRASTLVEIRPQARALTLWIALDRPVESPRVTRHIRASSKRVVNVVKLKDIHDFDDHVRAWLAEAYDRAE
jgi:hypothetical protein